MKVNIEMTKNAVMEFLLGPLETFTKVNIKMMKEMAMVKCVGLMVATMLEPGLEVYNTAMVK